MIKDITIGQYFPGNSIIHNLDPRIKILLVLTTIIVLFMISSVITLLMFISVILICYKISNIFLNFIFKSVKPLLFIMFFTSIVNMFFTEGQIIFKLWKITVSKEGVILSLILILRVLNMVMISSLLTYTTSPIELTYALTKLMKPLEIIRIPVSDISMMMTISLRFIPMLIQETDKIILAQKSRGAKINTGNVIQKVKSFIPIIIPLFVSAFRSADDLAISMESRCYNSESERTSMKQLKIDKVDLLILCLSILFFIIIFYIDRLIRC